MVNRYCAFCLPDARSEPRWVIEVTGQDGEREQRLAACDDCTVATFDLLRREYPQASNGAFSTILRMMPTDSILTFDEFKDEEARDA